VVRPSTLDRRSPMRRKTDLTFVLFVCAFPVAIAVGCAKGATFEPSSHGDDGGNGGNSGSSGSSGTSGKGGSGNGGEVGHGGAGAFSNQQGGSNSQGGMGGTNQGSTTTG